MRSLYCYVLSSVSFQSLKEAVDSSIVQIKCVRSRKQGEYGECSNDFEISFSFGFKV